MRGSGFWGRWVAAAAAMMIAATPAAAQFSDSYKFLKAVRDRDGNVVTEMVEKPGSTIINTKETTSGDTALHIVVKRRDATWLNFLLSKGANPNIRDGEGNTPMIAAAQLRFADGIQTLIAGKGDVNATNSRGESPLIIAVQNRDVASVRLLLAAGADASMPDRIAGMSARDYARQDGRSDIILKMIEDAKGTKPKGPVAGPTL
ncbi:ankyrin repeat domain-containing protein [Edaphosphingomonas fennica]|uniref:Ankyrin repeat domain-containing protein n=2 Tax=Edaphosphingomonas TaxID=3423724 RepID=A0A2T4I8K5_9SPHN|nr:ankyrin [Sphingomonas sp. MM-1]PTD28096.1 ankyrin repeat domain-containing protein [Sphingomonas fennica]